MTPTLISPPRLDVVPALAERCDRCGAAAKLSLTLASGLDLAFCGHHANGRAADILGQAEQVTIEEGFAWRGTDGTTH